MRRFLSIWLPRWPIESRLRARKHPQSKAHSCHSPDHRVRFFGGRPDYSAADDVPFALFGSSQKGNRIVATNKPAESVGIFKDMPLPDARALFTDLITEEATPEIDKTRLHQLALWLLRYSPFITTRPPEDIALDITGCAHLFGGEADMVSDIATKTGALGLTAQFGLADTLGAAWAAAHFGDAPQTIIPPGGQIEFLSPLPIHALRLEKVLLRRLQQLGLSRVRMLMDLPRAPLTSRFGPVLVNRIQQATGEKPEILDPITPPPDYRLSHAFIEPVLHLNAISYALEGLAQKMSHILDQKKKAARHLQFQLFRVDGHMEEVIVKTSRPCHEASHILLLFREKLSLLENKLDVGFGYEQVILAVREVETRSDHQSSWTSSRSEQQDHFIKLLDRLGNRIGFDRITRWQAYASHLPERAFTYIPVNATPSRLTRQRKYQEASTRPVILLPHPVSITALAEVPDGPPVRFKWRRKKHIVIAAEGPERLSPEWWRHDMRFSTQTRDYYRVEDKDGYRFWIFRDGLYEREQDHPRWFIHGFFP